MRQSQPIDTPTPVGARSGHRFSLNAMSAISMRGKMYFPLFSRSFNAPTCIAFFEKLIGHFPKEKIHPILDRHAVHQSKDVTTWMAPHPEAIELHFLSAYTPHLNPDELVNADLKRSLGDRNMNDINEMRANVTAFFRQVQKLTAIIQSYFQGPYVRYTIETIN